MIKKVVFFLIVPFNHRDYKRYGVEILSNNGFEVVIFDLSRALYPALWEKGVQKGRREGAIVFDNEKKAEEAIAKLTDECFVFCMFGYGRTTFKIFKALSRTNAPYGVPIYVIPDPQSHKQDSQVERFLEKISRITLTKFVHFLKKYPFRSSYAKYLGIREPNFALATGTKSPEHSNAGLIGKNTEILWLHSIDYDLYLDIINDMDLQNNNNHKTAVFLAPPGPLFARDDLVLGKKNPLTADKYYPSLCKLFSTIEKKLEVKVEIAGHPGADHERHPDCFGRRLTLQGQTIQMVSRSSFVITRDSSAINFAVLFKKPVIFITTNEAEADAGLSNSIHSMAWSLGQIPINIDRPYNINWNKKLLIDEKAYSNYRSYYIKKPGSEDLNSWQILANRLRNL